MTYVGVSSGYRTRVFRLKGETCNRSTTAGPFLTLNNSYHRFVKQCIVPFFEGFPRYWSSTRWAWYMVLTRLCFKTRTKACLAEHVATLRQMNGVFHTFFTYWTLGLLKADFVDFIFSTLSATQMTLFEKEITYLYWRNTSRLLCGIQTRLR